MRRTRLALPLLVIALLAGGCGGDDEKSSDVTAPHLTVPRSETATDTAATETTTGQSTTQSPPADTSGGSPAPSTQITPKDSPENDVPPPAGSPAERFEQECERDPSACG